MRIVCREGMRILRRKGVGCLVVHVCKWSDVREEGGDNESKFGDEGPVRDGEDDGGPAHARRLRFH